jgi:hypothetical protein
MKNYRFGWPGVAEVAERKDNLVAGLDWQPWFDLAFRRSTGSVTKTDASPTTIEEMTERSSPRLTLNTKQRSNRMMLRQWIGLDRILADDFALGLHIYVYGVMRPSG